MVTITESDFLISQCNLNSYLTKSVLYINYFAWKLRSLKTKIHNNNNLPNWISTKYLEINEISWRKYTLYFTWMDKNVFSNAANSNFMDKWLVLHYLLKNVLSKKCSDDLNYAGNSSCLTKHILWLVKNKLLTLNISWFTPNSLSQICIIISDFLYFLNSWNKIKSCCASLHESSATNKNKYSNIIFHKQLLIYNLSL